jgi:hypothetical protein
VKKSPIALIVIGLIALLIGGFLSYTDGAPKADPAMAQRCQEKMKAQNAEPSLLAQCDQTAFAVAMTATDAQAAAQAISAANNSEVGGSLWAKFFIGLGLVLFLGGMFLKRKTPA